MKRLVVEKDEAAGADGPRKGDCVCDARVTPADPLLVFVLEVLRVVEEDVDLVADGPWKVSSAGTHSDQAGRRCLSGLET